MSDGRNPFAGPAGAAVAGSADDSCPFGGIEAFLAAELFCCECVPHRHRAPFSSHLPRSRQKLPPGQQLLSHEQ
jgi:hypothetical protein